MPSPEATTWPETAAVVSAVLLLCGTILVRLHRDVYRLRRRLERLEEGRLPAASRPGPRFGVYRGPEVFRAEGHDDHAAN